MRSAYAIVGLVALAACAGSNPRAKHEEAMRAARKNQPTRALALLREALESAPEDVVIHRDYQNLMRRLNRLAEVQIEYRRRLDAAPTSPLWVYLHGRLLEGSDLEAAMKRCLDLDPTYFWGHHGLALYYKNHDRFVDALRHYEWILQRHPPQTLPEDVLINAAVSYSRTGRSEEALRLLEIATVRYPQSPLSPFYLGLQYWGQGRTEDAIRFLQEAISRDVDFFQGYAPLVQIYHGQGEFEKAAALRRKAKAMYRLHPIEEFGHNFEIHLQRLESWSLKVTEKLDPQEEHPLEPGTWYYVADVSPLASDRDVRIRYVLRTTEDFKFVALRRVSNREDTKVLLPVTRYDIATGDQYRGFHEFVIADVQPLLERFGR